MEVGVQTKTRRKNSKFKDVFRRFIKLFPSMATIDIANRIFGIASIISINLIIKLSIRPP